jgi:hypothetical protein
VSRQTSRPDGRLRPPSHKEAIMQCEDVNVGCATCTGLRMDDDPLYCFSCALYWRDVRNGMEPWP